MSERVEWKSGRRGCWWAIVPKQRDPIYPVPWLMGVTRNRAWMALRDHLEGHAINLDAWKCVRVFITEAHDARA